MPAYPMSPAPTFREVKDRLINDFGCQYKKLEVSVRYREEEEEEEETEASIPYFERDIESGTFQYPAVMEDYERINPTILRDICGALGIDPREFGLYLG